MSDLFTCQAYKFRCDLLTNDGFNFVVDKLPIKKITIVKKMNGVKLIKIKLFINKESVNFVSKLLNAKGATLNIIIDNCNVITWVLRDFKIVNYAKYKDALEQTIIFYC